MGKSVEDANPKPTVQVPPPVSAGFLAPGSLLGFSPGPMTLVSTLFPEQSQGQFSFSQLLAGAMASPMAVPNRGLSSVDTDDFGGKEGKKLCSSDLGKSAEGQKLNKPTNLAVPPPPESLNSLFAGLSPPGLLNSPGFLSQIQSPFGMSHQQALVHLSAQSALSQTSQKQAEFQNMDSADTLDHSFSAPVGTSMQQLNPSSLELEIPKLESSEAFQSGKQMASVSGEKPVGDGYNWRKYGQKQVKASECPRSYYKCSHLDCPVKKKVERSLDGGISEITYKGQHNHDPPPPNKRVKDNNCAVNSQANTVLPSQGSAPTTGNVVSSLPTNCQQSIEHNQIANQNDIGRGTTAIVNEEDDDELATKRRNTNIGPSIQASSRQAATDSKIVLQTRSEVDLLDDGYRWRKYGQKVVKGNPHPRSYYKCTYTGCNVRKHVERASSVPKDVITTYEGKHNHDIPTRRYSSSTSHQKKKDSSENTEIDYGNKDNQTPVTLQLKG